jgi:hypothetical protein
MEMEIGISLSDFRFSTIDPVQCPLKPDHYSDDGQGLYHSSQICQQLFIIVGDESNKYTAEKYGIVPTSFFGALLATG